MNDKAYVTQRNLSGIRNDGQRIDIEVSIGVPYKDNNFESWARPVKVEGLYSSLADQHGIDSWQAFRLSQKLVVSLLHDSLEKGEAVYLR